MFEKEAEEWANEMYPCDGQAQRYLLMGAEFGYNKANEWHKTSEKLPKDCSLVLAYGFDDTEPTLYYYVASDTWEWMPKRIAVYSNDQIRLWKEIILPKESEQKCITKFYFMSFL